EKAKALGESLGGPVPNLFELNGFKTSKERLALYQWAVESGQSPDSLKSLQAKVMNGEVELVLEKGEVKLKEVPTEARQAQLHKIYDRVPLDEIPQEHIQEVYVQDMKVENLGGGKFRYVAFREGKEVGNLTVVEEKDGRIFIGFADTPKEHRKQGVF